MPGRSWKRQLPSRVIHGVRPQSITPMAEVLRQNGFSTAAFGKYHETPPWEISVSGSLDRWPTHSGFDKFYGFIGGETNQWAPLVYDGTTQVETPGRSQLSLYNRYDQIKPSAGQAFNRHLHLTNRSSSILQPEQRMRHTMHRKNGLTSTKENSIRAGIK